MSDEKTPQCQGTDQGSLSTPEPVHDGGQGSPRLASGTAEDPDRENTPNRGSDIEPAAVSSSGKWQTIRRAWNWKPKPARYDPSNPPRFTIWLNLLFGFVSPLTSTSPHPLVSSTQHG